MIFLSLQKCFQSSKLFIFNHYSYQKQTYHAISMYDCFVIGYCQMKSLAYFKSSILTCKYNLVSPLKFCCHPINSCQSLFQFLILHLSIFNSFFQFPLLLLMFCFFYSLISFIYFGWFSFFSSDLHMNKNFHTEQLSQFFYC